LAFQLFVVLVLDAAPAVVLVLDELLVQLAQAVVLAAVLVAVQLAAVLVLDE
jgi:hypothetical protein